MTRKMQGRNWLSGTGLRAVSIALAVAVVLVAGLVATPSVRAQTYGILHKFTGGSDGGSPVADLLRDAAGNFYGTTEVGGAYGYGTVFKLDKTGTETVLYSFTGGTDGSIPASDLIMDSAGDLYGTTGQGGTGTSCFQNCGTVFKVDTTGKETVLHSFTGTPDGSTPGSGLVMDAAGNLYGTTLTGGASNLWGTVFKVDTAGTETVLYSFIGQPDAAEPRGDLVRDAAGNLYGATVRGGQYDQGTVFELDTAGTDTVLYSFTGLAPGDGGLPSGGVIRDAAGNLYGTTVIGGAYDYGIVFKVDPTGVETVLYSFAGGTDGRYSYAGLARDTAGNLYGTTIWGGGGSKACEFGCGVVFKLDATGKETVVHTFDGAGAIPYSGLVLGPAGILYGTTQQGGGFKAGVVFALKP